MIKRATEYYFYNFLVHINTLLFMFLLLFLMVQGYLTENLLIYY